MLNLASVAAKAAQEFGLSMKDDPTLWPKGAEVTADIVRKACNAVAAENARSAMARALGKIAEEAATAMDVAIAEDGPLADFDAVMAEYVEDVEVDLSGVTAAPDWQARVEALREALAVAVQSYTVPPVSTEDLLNYIGSDPRLDGEVMRQAAHGERPDVPKSLLVNQGGDVWDEPDAADGPDEADVAEDKPAARERGKPAPGRKRRTKAEIAEDEAAEAASAGEVSGGNTWDDEPAEAVQRCITAYEAKVIAPMVEAVQQWVDADAMPDWDDEPETVAVAPNLPGLVNAAGVSDLEMSEIMGLSKSYYSLVRNGKRGWPGLKPDQVKRLRAELEARREAIAVVELAISGPDVSRPGGV